MQIGERFGTKREPMWRKILDFSPRLKIRVVTRIFSRFFSLQRKNRQNRDF